MSYFKVHLNNHLPDTKKDEKKPAWEADGRFSFKGKAKFHKPCIGDLPSNPAKQSSHK